MKRKQNLVRAFSKLLFNWLVLGFWSIVLEILMLPYQIYQVFTPKRRPGRPGGHPFSKVFKKAFESKKSKRFVGAGLTILVMFYGVMGNILATDGGMVIDETLMITPEAEIVTEITLEKPLDGVMAQGFHGFHRGVDILAPVGTSIKSITEGEVVESSFGRVGWGNTVVVEHENGLKSSYAHLKDIRVVEGEKVKKNQEVGTVGMTGWTTGPHLHLEIYEDDRAVNPKEILPEFGKVIASR